VPIEDVFSISGAARWYGPDRARGDQGRRGSGDHRVAADDEDGGDGVEMFRKLLTRPGGRQHRRVVAAPKREEVERGQVLAKPGSITPHTKFKAEPTS